MAARRERLVDLWDRRAPSYDARTAGLERRLFAASRRWVCSRAHGAVLEIAVGTGANLAHYANDVDLMAVDWSEAMLVRARSRAEQLGRRVELRRADAMALPLEAGSVDTVVCTFSMCCIPDERAALAEAARVLRPGGEVLLADHVVATNWPLRVVQQAVDLVSVPLHGEHFSRRPAALLGELGLRLADGERLALGAIERVRAVRQG